MKHRHVMTIPNMVTFTRILLTPAICFFISRKAETVALWLFIVASITDYMDGYVAYRWKKHSRLGAILDPLADKLLMMMMFLFLVGTQTIKHTDVWICGIIMAREMIVLSMRSALGHHNIPVSMLAKWKTAVQFVAIALFIIQSSYASALLGVAAVLSVVTGYTYCTHAWSRIN